MQPNKSFAPDCKTKPAPSDPQNDYDHADAGVINVKKTRDVGGLRASIGYLVPTFDLAGKSLPCKTTFSFV